MSPSTFLLCYPEFAETLSTLIAAKLAQAAAQMGGPDHSVWGPFAAPVAPGVFPGLTIADVAHGALSAHLVITSPSGTNLRLDPKSNGRSSYLEVYEALQAAVAGGFLVSGIG